MRCKIAFSLGLLFVPLAVAHASSYLKPAISCIGGATVDAASGQSLPPFTQGKSMFTPVRNLWNARAGRNECWSACFNDFDECMGARTKNVCVSRVKTCLETCDRLSGRPGM